MATFNVEMRQRVSGAFSDIIYPKAHWGNIDGKPATFAPTTHTHDIDDIDATGTPSATTYLRGDGAWATPEGGGSSGGGWTSIKNWTGALATTGGGILSIPLTESIEVGAKYRITWSPRGRQYMQVDSFKVNTASYGVYAHTSCSYSVLRGTITNYAFSISKSGSDNTVFRIANAVYWELSGDAFDNSENPIYFDVGYISVYDIEKES